MKSFVLLIALSGLTAAAFAQTTPAPGVRMIEPGKEGGKSLPVPATTPAVKPEPIKPAAVAPRAEKPEDHTTIDSEASAMDTKNSVAIFSGSVVVKGPQFRLTTDGDFEVHMKKQPKEAKPDDSKKGEDSKKGGTPKAPATPPPGKPGDAKAPVTPASAADAMTAKPGEDNGVEKAIATGKMVTIEKKDAEGNVKIGKSRYALYVGKTGDITLRDWPQVQDGKNVIIATEASTYMILTQAGHLKVFGRSRTDIVGNQTAPQKGTGQVTPGAPQSAR